MSELAEAASSSDHLEFLEEFKKTNPHLKRTSPTSTWRCLWRLLTERHRDDDECCNQQNRPTRFYNCFFDHCEWWEDTNSGLPVLVGHPYCCHTDKHLHCIHGQDEGDDEFRDHHADVANYLAERGLWWKVSNASWYSELTSLVVIARVDVLGNIALPVDWDRPDLWKEQAVQHDRFLKRCEVPHKLPAYDPALDLLYPRVRYVRPVEDDWVAPDAPDHMREELLASRLKCPPLDYEMIEAHKLAEESVIRNRLAKKAPRAEAEGDYQLALNCYCDTAYLDRTGGFHRLAREQLAEAKRIITARPDLDTERLYFKNKRDRELICGTPLPTFSRLQLERRLRNVKRPSTWGRFTSDGHGTALAMIGGEKMYSSSRSSQRGKDGYARIMQGGNLNQWGAMVLLGSGPYIPTVSDDALPKTKFYETPEAAAEAAIDIWQRYDELNPHRAKQEHVKVS